jgi:hypothetical protein
MAIKNRRIIASDFFKIPDDAEEYGKEEDAGCIQDGR